MPTYDYECPKGHRFEAVQKMSDKPVATCPKCRSRARRVITGGGGFLLKGEGFYKTDYRSDDYKKKASAESGSPEKTDKAKSDGGSGEKAGAKSGEKAGAKSGAKSGTKS